MYCTHSSFTSTVLYCTCKEYGVVGSVKLTVFTKQVSQIATSVALTTLTSPTRWHGRFMMRTSFLWLKWKCKIAVFSVWFCYWYFSKAHRQHLYFKCKRHLAQFDFLPSAVVFTQAGIIRKCGQYKVALQNTVCYWKHHRTETQHTRVNTQKRK